MKQVLVFIQHLNLAIEEFPELHVEERSAISIGRRLQDPLSELVKIDPESIGVGLYQHDVSSKKLKESLRLCCK
jgi:protein Tex